MRSWCHSHPTPGFSVCLLLDLTMLYLGVRVGWVAITWLAYCVHYASIHTQATFNFSLTNGMGHRSYLHLPLMGALFIPRLFRFSKMTLLYDTTAPQR